jgi:hypothetical protein
MIVMPAQAGIQLFVAVCIKLDSRFRGNDK